VFRGGGVVGYEEGEGEEVKELVGMLYSLADPILVLATNQDSWLPYCFRIRVLHSALDAVLSP